MKSIRFLRNMFALALALGGTVWAQRTVSVVVTGNQISGTGAASVMLESQGNENALGFSVTFNPAVLRYDSFTAGTGATGATINPNDSQKTTGKVGFAIALSTGVAFSAGSKQLVVLNFTVLAPAASETIGFGNVPILREISDVTANEITAVTYSSATIATTLPPAAPTITTQPQSQTAVAGGFVMFSVVAGGNPTPTTFVWKKGGTTITNGTAASGAVITGATTAMMHIAGVTATEAGSYTVTVGNGISPDATSTPAAALTVTPALSTTLAVAGRSLTIGVAATSFTPVTAADGTPGYTYAVNPPLPAGLTLSTSTGAVSGTPTAAATIANYTITVTDSATATSSKVLSLTVNPAVVATQAVATTTVNAGPAITPFTPVTAAGGTAPLVFTVAPALPGGLAISASTGAISGTASAASGPTTHTVTATDSLGAFASATFSLTVNGPFTTAVAMSNATATFNTAVTAFTPVTAAGGATPYTFAVSPALPSGLSLNTSTGAISGTPTAAAAAATFTITVMDFSPANPASSSKTFSLTVAKAAQTITFGSLPTKTFGDANFALTATSSSGLTVEYTSSNTNVATVSGSTVTIVGGGNSTIVAGQLGNANYNGATPVAIELVVNKAAATVTIDTTSLSQVYTGAGRVATATTNPTGLNVAFSFDGNATPPINAGTYAVVATIIDPRYQGSTTPASLVVAKAPQLITFAAISSKALDDPLPLVLGATASSGLPVSYASSDPSVAEVNAATGAITLKNTGATTITASIGESPNHLAASSVPQVLNVSPNLQTIDFAPLAGRTFVANDTFTISASAKGRTGNNTGLAVAFGSSAPTVATVGVTTLTDGVSTATVTVLTAGTADITASQAGNANFAAANPNVVRPLVIAKAAATVALGSLAATFDNTPKAATATTVPVNLNVVFAYGAAPGSATPPINAGTYAVVATIQENNFTGTVAGNLVIAKANQTITFPAVGSPKLINATPFALTATAAPSGLAVIYTSSSPGVASVSGNTVTVHSLGTTTLTAKQAGDPNYNAAADETQTLTVNPVAPVIVGAPALVPAAIRGSPFLYGPISLNALSRPATFSATGLPAGLQVNPVSGNIGGIPTVEGTFPVTLTVSNATSPSDSKSITIVVQPSAPIITSPAAVSAVAGSPFTYTVVAAPATGVTITATGLPGWLTLTGAVLSGTPPEAGVATVLIAATNATGAAVLPLTINSTLPANAPAYSGPANLAGTAGTPFTLTPNFGAGTTTYTQTGALPAGLSQAANFASTGTIAGTPTQTGSFPIAIAATRAGLTATANLIIRINPAATAPIVSVTGGNVRSATVGTAITPIAFTTTPATATSFTFGTLPGGLSLGGTAAAPTISGTPTTPGTTNISITASDGVRTGPASTLVIVVNPHPQAPMVTSAPVVLGRVLVPLATYTLAATPAVATTYSMTGTLPTGLTFDGAAGTVTGTPAAGTMGSYRVFFAGTSVANGIGLALEVTFHIGPPLTAPVVTSNGTAAAQVGQAFTYQIVATGTPSGYGATPLPAGLNLNPGTGVISGVPTTATAVGTTFSVTLTATDANGTSNPKMLAITIVPAPATPVITSADTANGRVGTAFTYRITASATPTSYAATDLPLGLVTDPVTGVISGTPTQSGGFVASLRAANENGLGAATSFAVAIAPAPLAPAITSAATAVGQVGEAFTYQIVAAPGPITSYAYTYTGPIANSTLETIGLSLNSATGLISGSPTRPGPFSVSLAATSDAGTSSPQALVIQINPAANVPVITSPRQATANVGAAFSYTITATNSPFVSLDAVNLPPGLAVNPYTGLIQGLPTTVGSSVASLVGTNAAGTGPTRDLAIVVQPALTAPRVTSADRGAARVGVNFAYQITATGSPTSFEVIGAPAWMTVNTSTGEIAGTPTAPGVLHVFLLATNSAGASGPQLFFLSIAPAANTPLITSSRTASGTVGTVFAGYATTALPAATSFVATGLPPGLSMDAAGVISGTPVKSGVYQVNVSASNANGVGAPTFVVITIVANITFTQ